MALHPGDDPAAAVEAVAHGVAGLGGGQVGQVTGVDQDPEPRAPVEAGHHPDRQGWQPKCPRHQAAGRLGQRRLVDGDLVVPAGHHVDDVLERLGPRQEVLGVCPDLDVPGGVGPHPGSSEHRRRRLGAERAEGGHRVAGGLLGEEVGVVEVELPEVVDRHPRAAGDHDRRALEPVVGECGTGHHGAETVGHHGQRLAGPDRQGPHECSQVGGGLEHLAVTRDRPGRRSQHVSRLVVRLPQDDRRRAGRLEQVARRGEPLGPQVHVGPDARHQHGHVVHRPQVAQLHAEVVALGPVDEQRAVGQERLEQCCPGCVTGGPGRGQVPSGGDAVGGHGGGGHRDDRTG